MHLSLNCLLHRDLLALTYILDCLQLAEVISECHRNAELPRDVPKSAFIGS